MLVGKLYPSHSYFASVVDVKGPDDKVTGRLADFFKSSGISTLVYKSDQEPAIVTAVEQALLKIRRTGEPTADEEFISMVPENSAMGESPSNGKAERAVQTIEDMVRTYLSALEGRLKCGLSMSLPIFRRIGARRKHAQ